MKTFLAFFFVCLACQAQVKAQSVIATNYNVLTFASWNLATNRSAQIATAAGCGQDPKDGTKFWFMPVTNGVACGLLVPLAETNKLTTIERAALVPYTTNFTNSVNPP
jgi:K+-sensing histidine kinase KdpD